jgi:hypothetical protein
VPSFECYFARADAAVAARLGETSPFTIEVRFLGGLTSVQQDAFKHAADRWSRVIAGDLPSVEIEQEVIDDVLIFAQGQEIDGAGKVLGQAGPTHLRPARAGFLPARGVMVFDVADLDRMERDGNLDDVIAHEMGHVLGVGTLWRRRGLLGGAGTENPTFVGAGAQREYGALRGRGPTPVPVENTGGAGTAESHWREAVFASELMTGFVAAGENPLSRLTVASLADLGYVVSAEGAEPYALPDALEFAESGALARATAHVRAGIMLPTIPLTCSDDSLR